MRPPERVAVAIGSALGVLFVAYVLVAWLAGWP